MTRYVFEKVAPFKEWIADHVTSEKYEAYITPNNEVVLVHLWLKENGVKIYSADVDWDDTKPPGVEYIPRK
ncbi:MAG: hypothetical protein NTZ84_00380 [Candidatus Nealsonbacteria bacterium]|nr:hypothetical protein [Candidatus Nealsonbacteria bacterium]